MIPTLYQVDSITHDTADVFTLALRPKEKIAKKPFLPGQFNMLYHFGLGEVAISISGDPSNQDVLIHTIRAVGSVTKKMQELKVGEAIGVRGPFGSCWPKVSPENSVLIIAGGIGLATLRPALFQLALERRNDQKITLLYGARDPDDLLYRDDFKQWQEQGIRIETTVDASDVNWNGHVGVVTKLIKKNIHHPEKTCVFMCGPEVMMQSALQELLEAEVDKKQIFLSLERNMQCALGFCGRCQYGPYFLCKEGPILSYRQLEPWLKIKEL